MLKQLIVGMLLPATLTLTASAKQPTTFSFAWPVPGKVTVTETVQKKGKTMKMRYQLELTRMKKSKDIRVHYSGFEFIEFENHPLTAEMKGAMGPLMDMFSDWPDLRIADNGEARDVIDLEKTIDRFYMRLEKIRGQFGVKTDPEEEEPAIDFMKTPEVFEMMKEKYLEPWQYWVESWAELDLAFGEMYEYHTEVPVFGTMMPARVTYINHGPAKEHPGAVELTSETVYCTEGTCVEMLQALNKLLIDSPGGPIDPNEAKNARGAGLRVNIVTNPRTLRPIEVKTEKIIESVQPGQGEHTWAERHIYMFSWER